MWNGRDDHFERTDAISHSLDGGGKHGKEPLKLPGSASRQHEHDWGTGISPTRLLGIRAQLFQPLRHRMPDIGAGRPSQFSVNIGLEWQHRQHVVDIGPHRLGASGAPGPNRWRDIVDNGYGRSSGADAAGYRMGEARAVDDDERMRPSFNHLAHTRANHPPGSRKAARNRDKADQRDAVDGAEARNALLRHPASADAGKAELLAAASAQRAHEGCAKLIAGFLCCYQKQVKHRTKQAPPRWPPIWTGLRGHRQ